MDNGGSENLKISVTFPAAPLPCFTSLLHAFNASAFDGNQWVAGRRGYVARIFNRGRIALAAGFQAIGKAAGRERIVVWFPGYFCNEALDPVRILGFKINFYPIQKDLSPDWSFLERQAKGGHETQVLVLVHYFGFPNAIERARVFCDQYQMVLLEDAAHVLLPGSGVGRGDLQVYSPRKMLAVPSGGILVATEELAGEVAVIPGKGKGRETLYWLIRRLVQKCFAGLHIPWHFIWTYPGQALQSSVSNGFVAQSDLGCDSYALGLLNVMASQVYQVIEQRRRNYQRLLEWVSGIVQALPLFPDLPDGVCPYAFPLLVHRGSENVVAKLRSWGIPASRWPDLPPEVLASEEEHKVAIKIYKQLILLPIHQSLTLKQVDMIGRHLITATATTG